MVAPPVELEKYLVRIVSVGERRQEELFIVKKCWVQVYEKVAKANKGGE